MPPRMLRAGEVEAIRGAPRVSDIRFGESEHLCKSLMRMKSIRPVAVCSQTWSSRFRPTLGVPTHTPSEAIQRPMPRPYTAMTTMRRRRPAYGAYHVNGGTHDGHAYDFEHTAWLRYRPLLEARSWILGPGKCSFAGLRGGKPSHEAAHERATRRSRLPPWRDDQLEGTESSRWHRTARDERYLSLTEWIGV
jgi:hypothetical protein